LFFTFPLFTFAPFILLCFKQAADFYGEGQDQIFAVSGAGNTATLRLIRNGLAVQVLTSTPRDFNVSGIWLVGTYVV
jgi:Mono-functional DNA-alkylating methyl methanesulfonate N-term